MLKPIEFNFLRWTIGNEGEDQREIVLSSLGIQAENILPYRFPALGLIDGVIDSQPNGIDGAQITAIRFLRPEDPFFVGHFPDNPVCPGHILSEMANLSAAMLHFCLYGKPEIEPKIYADEGKKLRNEAHPYDTLFIRAFNPTNKTRSFACDVEIYKFVDDKIVFVAEFRRITGMKRDSHLKKAAAKN